MSKYIWQKKEWPHFTSKSAEFLSVLSKARKLQGQIIAHADSLGLEAQAQVLTEEVLTTSAIENEKLNLNSLRSSVAQRLGLPTLGLTQSFFG